jgi:5,10-methylenetetrahydromethanopterin reductase
MVGIYASSMPSEQLARNGVDAAELKPIIDAIAGGDLAKGIELTSPELAERLSVSGSPAECAAKIRDEIAPAGVNHMILAITDRSLVKTFTGMDIEGVADVDTQLRLIHDEVIPAV